VSKNWLVSGMKVIDGYMGTAYSFPGMLACLGIHMNLVLSLGEGN